MNNLVIKSEKIEFLKSQYGKDIVMDCFSMASKALPAVVYSNLEDKTSNLAKCFIEIFGEIIDREEEL